MPTRRARIRTTTTKLGGLALTPEGLEQRDRRVIDGCVAGIPVVVTLGGGYARHTQRHGAHPRHHLPARARGRRPGETSIHAWTATPRAQRTETDAACAALASGTENVWLDFEGEDEAAVNRLRPLGVHPLVLEDMVAQVNRPKVDDYGDYLTSWCIPRGGRRTTSARARARSTSSSGRARS